MHIVALIEGSERVLCSLRFYKENGLFCATPGFSIPIVEPENDPELLIKGPKLTTHHVSTQSGSLYEYVLDNAHDLLPFASTEDQRLSREIRLQEEKRDIAAVTRWELLDKASNVSEQRYLPNDSTQRKWMLSLEVVTVDNPQTTDPVYVEYELELPSDMGYSYWKLEPRSRQRGKTTLSLPQHSQYPCCISSAVFKSYQHFQLKLVEAADISVAQTNKACNFGETPPTSTLHLRVYSQDSWGRNRMEGHGEIKLPSLSGYYDLDVRIRKTIIPICARMEELFLGIGENDADQSYNGEWSLNKEVGTDESPISTMITSRLGHKSESTGTTVRIRFNIVDMRPSTHIEASYARRAPLITATPSVSTRVVKRSVQEILQSVKLEKRIASITDPHIQAALRSLPPSGVATTT
ncbi:unnamed protein product [Phytophthora fragariaefolia]|uniref:Unnamed protein product n=1 Tax=Phytophthora fragariaefolia TaxID=1490495 RepID=A0A9W6X2L2_9STRA|nr:unnamed protein product [Phytophthora fragariaefolia]